MANIEKRGKNKYRLSVIIGYTETGKVIRERKTIQAKNQTEAKKELSKFEAEILSGHYIKPDQTKLRDFYHDWLEKYARTSYKPDTIRDYTGVLNTRVLPAYGNLKLSEIKPIHIVNFMDNIQKMAYGWMEKTALYPTQQSAMRLKLSTAS
ncbi:N-terminal phage integrase SAM-like domain-containing protein [Salibacterium aidingense]|uniref:N-terminal phage integrase SAM-like domain-containing protein n=1 Tax=Salibacterium aidingense TaxID=384933 RepID=UPI00047CD471|nr:N-terminal phage integrase SAM-like domain-containing protein [Salibacterium aidingense]